MVWKRAKLIHPQLEIKAKKAPKHLKEFNQLGN